MTAVLTYRGKVDGTHQLLMLDHLDSDCCGCPKPEGVYGSHGWHHTRATPAVLVAHEKARFAKERPGYGQIQLRAEWESLVDRMKKAGEWDEQRGMPKWLLPYLGTSYALEPCPAYRAAVSRDLAQEKRRKSTGGRKRIYGEEEE